STGSAVSGQSVTLTATVGGSAGGTVTFSDSGTVLGVVAVGSSGQAALTTSDLAVGSHMIAAAYSGDANHSAATSGSDTVTVATAASQITLVPHAVLRKKKVISLSLEANINPVAPGGGVPTGTVTFEMMQKKKVKILGTASLAGGSATLTVKPNAVWNKPITI